MARIASIQLNRSLILQIPDEMRRVEQLLDEMRRKAALRRRFAKDPTPVLVERGIVPDGARVDVKTANRILISIVSNRKLLAWVRKNAPISPPPPRIAAAIAQWQETGGPLDIPNQYRVGLFREFARHERFLRQLLAKLARDPAVKEALPAGIGPRELDTVVTAGMREILRGAKAGRLPQISSSGDAFLPVVFVVAIVIAVVAVFLWTVVIVWASVLVGGVAALDPRDQDALLLKGLSGLADQLGRLEPART